MLFGSWLPREHTWKEMRGSEGGHESRDQRQEANQCASINCTKESASRESSALNQSIGVIETQACVSWWRCTNNSSSNSNNNNNNNNNNNLRRRGGRRRRRGPRGRRAP